MATSTWTDYNEVGLLYEIHETLSLVHEVAHLACYGRPSPADLCRVGAEKDPLGAWLRMLVTNACASHAARKAGRTLSRLPHPLVDLPRKYHHGVRIIELVIPPEDRFQFPHLTSYCDGLSARYRRALRAELRRRRDIQQARARTAERRRMGPGIRYDVMRRDRWRCVLCGATARDDKLVVDHIRPIAKRGRTELANLRTLCYRCNAGKAAKIEA